MVVLPKEFTATRYPGYFWNVKTRTLFTAKLGVLRQMKLSTPNRWNHLQESGYKVSHEGKREFLPLSALNQLQIKDSVFPVQFTTTKSSTNDDVAVDLKNLPAGTRVRVVIEG